MKKVFVKTKNVKQLISMMNRLREREDGVPGMGLVYGEPGLGKTYAITWWAAQNDAILIRSANLMSARWLLEEMVEELGEIPYNKFSDIFNQVVSQLIKTPRTIIVDETDYLTIDSRAVETLRDIVQIFRSEIFGKYVQTKSVKVQFDYCQIVKIPTTYIATTSDFQPK